jgi:hypothetical protein
MHSYQVFAILAFTSSVLAAPVPTDWDAVNYDYSNVKWDEINYGPPAAPAPLAPKPEEYTAAPAPAPATTPEEYKPVPAPKPVEHTPVPAAPKPIVPAPKPVIAAPKPEVPAPKPEVPAPKPEVPAPKPEVPAPKPAPAPSTGGYMDVVNEYMTKLGLREFECDPKLEANALDTVKSSHGKMVHKLNPGSFGQVLAPGGPSDFKHAFVGGWLCERPSLLNGECASASEGWTYSSTGHADIITNQSYKSIGCADFDGIIGCDFGY